ncbi:dUTP diphosphatase [Buchnera aphidicola (Thelaxes californica)]|uniref:dUTP diphosphatase n=1 Tax=Buchnera aphidicola (Thelaxes californica) TaxID=1315998 RepID=A0A4D6YLV2_9GAMM|nr:dUTP diphosphatase [Buchnera aphidicola]QCI26954.1 dUTP diphosphatase [Buchnera aphidicola (Thelaxes californica)]
MNLNIDIKIVDSRIGTIFSLPDYSTPFSSGIDLRACCNKKILLYPNKTILISSGIAININNSMVTGMIFPRSGLGHKCGIVLGNLVGIIDSDFQGEIMLSIWNRQTECSFCIEPGMRIAQLVFVPIIKPKFHFVEKFNNVTKRGKLGFGHTGKF